MGNSSYFHIDDDNKTKYIYSLNHHKEMGLMSSDKFAQWWWDGVMYKQTDMIFKTQHIMIYLKLNLHI